MDKCRDVLIHGLDVIRVDSATSVAHDLKRFFLSSSFRDFVRQRAAGATIGIPPIDGLPPLELGISSDDSEIEQFQQRIMEMEEEHFRFLADSHFLRQMASPLALEQWGKCMDNAPIKAVVEEYLDSVDVTLIWNPQRDGEPNPTIQSCSYAPLEVDELVLKQGTRVPIDGISQRFRRPDKRGAAILIDTTAGTWRGVVRPLPLVVTTPTDTLAGAWKGKYVYVDGPMNIRGKPRAFEITISGPSVNGGFLAVFSGTDTGGDYVYSPDAITQIGDNVVFEGTRGKFVATRVLGTMAGKHYWPNGGLLGTFVLSRGRRLY